MAPQSSALDATCGLILQYITIGFQVVVLIEILIDSFRYEQYFQFSGFFKIGKSLVSNEVSPDKLPLGMSYLTYSLHIQRIHGKPTKKLTGKTNNAW